MEVLLQKGDIFYTIYAFFDEYYANHLHLILFGRERIGPKQLKKQLEYFPIPLEFTTRRHIYFMAKCIPSFSSLDSLNRVLGEKDEIMCKNQDIRNTFFTFTNSKTWKAFIQQYLNKRDFFKISKNNDFQTLKFILSNSTFYSNGFIKSDYIKNSFEIMIRNGNREAFEWLARTFPLYLETKEYNVMALAMDTDTIRMEFIRYLYEDYFRGQIAYGTKLSLFTTAITKNHFELAKYFYNKCPTMFQNMKNEYIIFAAIKNKEVIDWLYYELGARWTNKFIVNNVIRCFSLTPEETEYLLGKAVEL
jgi:hypothetical protein